MPVMELLDLNFAEVLFGRELLLKIGAIDPGVIDRYLSETETLGRLSPSPLRMTSAALDVPTLFEPDQFCKRPACGLSMIICSHPPLGKSFFIPKF